ncbi:hypothetical protein SAICODRAFT_7174 [Saitoella complicata NRRL Y-17804]|nr:uncharacterized protein SAICODRAFT_7174 [Saitoella complicata NRRL Y-17804]ODQ53460.1 hypothetical protein SAICODRAFT_7174 [Saitoella complicata NRRL Y-17804]
MSPGAASKQSMTTDCISSQDAEELRKEHAYIAARIESLARKMQLETKICEAAVSLSRLHVNSQTSIQAEEQLTSANHRVNEIASEILVLSKRSADMQKKLEVYHDLGLDVQPYGNGKNRFSAVFPGGAAAGRAREWVEDMDDFSEPSFYRPTLTLDPEAFPVEISRFSLSLDTPALSASSPTTTAPPLSADVFQAEARLRATNQTLKTWLKELRTEERDRRSFSYDGEEVLNGEHSKETSIIDLVTRVENHILELRESYDHRSVTQLNEAENMLCKLWEFLPATGGGDDELDTSFDAFGLRLQSMITLQEQLQVELNQAEAKAKESEEEREWVMKNVQQNHESEILGLKDELERLRKANEEEKEEMRKQMEELTAQHETQRTALVEEHMAGVEKMRDEHATALERVLKERDDVSALEGEHHQLRSEHEDVKSELSSLQALYKQVAGDHDTLQSTHSGISAQLQSLLSEHEQLKHNFGNLEFEHASRSAELEKLMSTHTAATSELEQAQKTIDEMVEREGQRAAAITAAKEIEISLRKQVDNLQQTIRAMEDERSADEQEIRFKLKEAEAELAEAQTEIAALKEELVESAKVEKELLQTEEQLEQVRSELAERETRLEAVGAQLAATQAKAAKTEADYNRLRDAKAALDKEVAELIEFNNDAERMLHEMRARAGHAEDRVAAVEVDLARMEMEKKKADDHLADAEETFTKLQRERADAEERVKATEQHAKEEVEGAEGRVRQIESLMNGLRIELEELRSIMITQEAKMKKEHEEKIMMTEQQHKLAEDGLREKLSRSEGEWKAMEGEMRGELERLRGMEREVQSLRTSNVALLDEIRILKDRAVPDGELDGHGDGNEPVLRQQCHDLQRELDGMLGDYERLTRSHLAFESERAQLDKTIDGLHKQVDTLSAQLADAKVALLGRRPQTPSSAGSGLSGGDSRELREGVSTSTLRLEFRNMVREMREVHRADLGKEREERRALELRVRTLQDKLGVGKI